ncbi:hypothetical protein Tcan_15412 [Toxocara canis]|uniref:F-box domain-containing protein n=1 Tax=Toxocara canis TaxID=6265 RepID=A0A0B2VTY9_TOXCA|nr:hypothetical protein Tcan_15412 [Toxocara canis]
MEVDDDERMNEERVVDESFASVDSPSFPLQISTSTSAMASVDYRTMAASAGMSQVIIRDPCNPSRDGMFPIDEAKLAEQHRWKFVEWYPRCCLGCSINGAYPVQGGPSGYALIAEPEDITSPVADAKPQPTSDEALSEDEVEDRIFLEDLPDVVLLRIIEYVHPVERVHNISVLSKRWNRLVKSHTLWREVRIFICDPPYYKNSVAEFLHRMGPWIEKLCISISCTEPFTERQFIDLFPSVMPSVKLLDIGFFSSI